MTRRTLSAGSGVALPLAVRRAIVDHARREAPLECCGLLLGRGRAVTFAAACTNAARSATRYRIHPREHIDVRRTLRKFSPPLEIVGVYHSHPSGRPVPSATDIAEARYPTWVHLIVGLRASRPEIVAYQIRGGRVRTLLVHAPPRAKR